MPACRFWRSKCMLTQHYWTGSEVAVILLSVTLTLRPAKFARGRWPSLQISMLHFIFPYWPVLKHITLDMCYTFYRVRPPKSLRLNHWQLQFREDPLLRDQEVVLDLGLFIFVRTTMMREVRRAAACSKDRLPVDLQWQLYGLNVPWRIVWRERYMKSLDRFQIKITTLCLPCRLPYTNQPTASHFRKLGLSTSSKASMLRQRLELNFQKYSLQTSFGLTMQTSC